MSAQELVEEFSFIIDKFKMDHQGEVQTLNIKISVRYGKGIRDKDYPDFRSIARDVETPKQVSEQNGLLGNRK